MVLRLGRRVKFSRDGETGIRNPGGRSLDDFGFGARTYNLAIAYVISMRRADYRWV